MKLKQICIVAVMVLITASVFSQTGVTICDRPQKTFLTNVTQREANFNWLPVPGTDTWTIEVGLRGFTPRHGNPLISGTVKRTTPSLTNFCTFELNGLSPGVEYFIYIKTECPYGGSSWVGPVKFRTLSSSITPGTGN